MTRLAQRVARLETVFRLGPPAGGSPASARLLSVGMRLLVAAVVLQSLGHVVDYVVFDLRIDVLNVNQEYSTTAWAGTGLTFAAAFLIAEALIVTGRRSLPLVALVGAIAFLSLDDMISIHERVVLFDPEGDSLRYLNRIFWPAVYAPLLLYGFGGLWLLAASLEPQARRLVRGGLALLGFALALEALGTGVLLSGSTRDEAPYNVEVLIEEAAELAGWGMIALALAAWRYRAAAPEGDELAETPLAEAPHAAVPSR